jgi:hypothetical protein
VASCWAKVHAARSTCAVPTNALPIVLLGSRRTKSAGCRLVGFSSSDSSLLEDGSVFGGGVDCCCQSMFRSHLQISPPASAIIIVPAWSAVCARAMAARDGRAAVVRRAPGVLRHHRFRTIKKRLQTIHFSVAEPLIHGRGMPSPHCLAGSTLPAGTLSQQSQQKANEFTH